MTSGPRWVFWSIAALGGVAALAAGALLSFGSKPRNEATPAPSTPLPAVGLPDVRLQDKFVTSRERELLRAWTSAA